MIDFITFDNKENLINGVVLHQLEVNQDESGILVEVLKTNWPDVFGDKLPFAQCYFSITPSGAIRDKDLWHMHPTKQEDRFVVVRGDIVTALFDNRSESSTFGRLNLFFMGESQKEKYLLLIPKKVLHGFCVVSSKEAVLLNFPTSLYDPAEESRISHEEARARFSDGTDFDWNKIIKKFS